MKHFGEKEIKCFNQIVIDELSESYSVKLLGDDNSNFYIQYGKGKDEDKLVELVNSYLDSGEVNGLSKSIPVIKSGCGNKSYADVFIQNSSKLLRMYIYSPKFRIISKIAREKYLNDRADFFRNEDINTIMLSAMPEVNKYDVVDGIINLILGTDQNINILVSEREFISELLEYKCGGRKIDVFFYEKEHKSECIVSCGEFKMIFPRGYTFSTILGIIQNHNLNIEKIRKRK